MDWKESAKARDWLIEAIEYAAQCAVSGIDEQTESHTDADAARAVLDLVQARSILIAEAAAMEQEEWAG